jgi:hypothetical protein
MKRNSSFILILLLAFAVSGQSQTVITPRDVPRTVGLEIQYYTETGDSIPVNVGVPGGPQTWDFTQGDTASITTDLYLDPLLSPPEYSRANVVIETDQLNMAGITEPGVMYCYLNPVRFIVGAVETEYEGETVGIMFSPCITQYPLPLEMGANWSNNIYVDETFTIPGYELRIELTATMTGEVDAYGTVQVPAGDFDVLRIRNDVTYDVTVSILIFFIWVPIIEESGSGINYDWRAIDEGTVLNIMSNTNDPYFAYANSIRRLMNSGITTSSEGEQSLSLATSETPLTFELREAYPNPFNNETVIEFNLDQPSRVDLRIFDILGRQVAVLDQGYHSEGITTIHWHPDNLSAGVYILQLQANDQLQRQVVVYMK